MTSLPDLLKAVRSATGQLEDQVLGEVLARLKGVEFAGFQKHGTHLFMRTKSGFYSFPRNRAPDNSIDAAMALVRERWSKISYRLENEGDGCVFTFSIAVGESYSDEAVSEPLAILAAALSALIKENVDG